MNIVNDIHKEIYNYNILYYYFLYLSIFFVFFFILGIFLIYKTRNISYITWIVLLFLFTIFLENIGLFYCYNRQEDTTEGWHDYQCFRIYSQYANTQSQIDKFDISYTCLKNAVDNKIADYKNEFKKFGAKISEQGEIVENVIATNNKYKSLQDIVNGKIDDINTNLNTKTYTNIIMQPTK